MRIAISFGVFKHIIEALWKDRRSFLAANDFVGGCDSRACDLLWHHFDCNCIVERFFEMKVF